MAKTTAVARTSGNGALAPSGRPSLIAKLAAKYSVDAEKMLATLKATAFRGNVTNEQMMALLVVADQYDLNPWTKEIYAFPDKQNGIVPVIGVDGWARIINSNEHFDGMEFVEGEPNDKGIPEWIECVIYRKDRNHPTRAREYFAEVYRNTGPWNSHPRRMLRHKAMIQCARLAFGFVGVYDQDEAERIREAIDVTPAHVAVPKPDTEPPKAKPAAVEPPNEVPVDEIRAKLDMIGIPENEFLDQFQADSIESLPLDKVQEAIDWIDRVAQA